MKFGAQLVNYMTTWESTLPTIKTVEAGRYNSLWWSDHFLPPVPGNYEDRGALEGWSLITAAAAITERVELGLLVSGNTYRNPALLAKMATAVDEISGGRYILGFGAAWFQREHEAYGFRFPGLKERCDRLEEAAELIRLLFTSDEPVTYNGKYYSLDNAPLSPGCTTQPNTPILIGGNGEKRTLLTCAKYADVCNIDFNNPGSPEIFEHKIRVLSQHCENIGRDPAEIRKTMLIPLRIEDDEKRGEELRRSRPWTLTGTTSYIADLLQQYIEAGAEEIMFAGVPTRAEFYDRIDKDILAQFD